MQRMETDEEVREVPVTVQRPVTERIVNKIPVQTVRWEEEEQVRQVPYTVQRIEYEEQVEQIPVQVCRYVNETKAVQVPRTVGKWVAYQTTRLQPRIVTMRGRLDADHWQRSLRPPDGDRTVRARAEIAAPPVQHAIGRPLVARPAAKASPAPSSSGTTGTRLGHRARKPTARRRRPPDRRHARDTDPTPTPNSKHLPSNTQNTSFDRNA